MKKILKLFMWFMLYFAITMLCSIPLVIATIFEWITPENPMFIIYAMVTTIPATLFFYLLYANTHRNNAPVINFSLKQIDKKSILLALLLALLSFVALFLFNVVFKPTESSETTKLMQQAGVLGLIFAAIVAPITEEVIFRGIFGHILRDENDFVYCFSIGALFGLMHYQFTGVSINDLVVILLTGSMGMLFAYFYKKTNNIYVPMIAHFLYNGSILTLGNFF